MWIAIIIVNVKQCFGLSSHCSHLFLLRKKIIQVINQITCGLDVWSHRARPWPPVLTPPPARGRVTPSSLPDAHQVCCDNDVFTVRNLRVVHYKHCYIAILRSPKLLQILTTSRMRECIRPPRFKLARGVIAKNIQSDDPHTLSQYLKSL